MGGNAPAPSVLLIDLTRRSSCFSRGMSNSKADSTLHFARLALPAYVVWCERSGLTADGVANGAPRCLCVDGSRVLLVRFAVCPLLVRFAVCPLLGLVRVFCLFKLKEISKASCIARLLSSSPSSAQPIADVTHLSQPRVAVSMSAPRQFEDSSAF